MEPIDAPTGIDLDEEHPQGKSPMPRLLYVAGGVIAVVFCCGMVMLYRNATAHKEQERQKVTQELAAEPAPSSRTAIQRTEPDPKPLASSDTAYSSQPERSPVSAIAPVPVQPTHPELGYQPATRVQVSMSPELQALIDAQRKAAEEEQRAREAPSTVHWAGVAAPTAPPPAANPYSALLPAQNPGTADLAALANRLLPRQNESVTTEGNGQDQKRQFLQGKEPEDHTLVAARAMPLSPFELMQGDNIPAETEDTMNSDQPGEVRAKVRRDVYDTLTGKYLLIPANSRLIGEYNSTVGYGQNRLQVVWTRLIFPDTTSLDLGRMNSHSGDGSAGLQDQTDNHWKRTIAGAALSSLLSAGLQISQNRTNTSTLSYPSTGQVAAASIGQNLSQLGQRITERNLNVPPTLKIRGGKFFSVRANKDIVFPEPYQAREIH